MTAQAAGTNDWVFHPGMPALSPECRQGLSHKVDQYVGDDLMNLAFRLLVDGQPGWATYDSLQAATTASCIEQETRWTRSLVEVELPHNTFRPSNFSSFMIRKSKKRKLGIFFFRFI